MTDPITPAGFARLREEYDRLMRVERPQIVETVAWAAGNGDRSENGDYIYGRQKLRQIDRRAAHLARRMKAVTVVDPAGQQDQTHVRFGATVTLVDGNDDRRILRLVGSDESDAGAGDIAWNAPLARALRGAVVGDVRTVVTPGGEREWEVLAISY